MFSVSKKSDSRVDIAISGKLDAKAMEAALSELEVQTENMTDGRMLYTISEIELPTFGALRVEFTHMPKLFSLIYNVKKCAVVADAAWARAAASVEGALVPGMKIKTFTPDQLDQAEAWLST